MSNKMSWKAEPTSIIWLDEDKPVTVNSLPDDIKFDLETYDRMRQSFLDLRYQMEIAQLAVSGKYNQIVVKIKNATKTKPTGDENDGIAQEQKV